MTSLVLTRFRPDNPAGGAALRNWQNIQALARLGPVDVVSITEHEEEGNRDPAPAVRQWMPFVRRRLRANRSVWQRVRFRAWFARPGGHPALDAYYFEEVSAWLRARAAEHRYGLIVIEELSLSPYMRGLKRSGCRVVFDAHNVESVLRAEMQSARSGQFRSLRHRTGEWLLRRRLAERERKAVCDADLVWACSDVDAAAIRRVYGRGAGVTVVPNGVDVESYAGAAGVLAGDSWDRSPVTLIYPGTFSYYPNADAAMRLIQQVLPSLRSRGHEARVVLVGRSPTPAMMAAAKNDPAVEVTGTVPSIAPYLAGPCIVVLPIALGSGTRLKILEAFASRRPVISTAKGAEGIEARDGEHLLIRNDSEAMAMAAIELWNSPARRAAIADRALELVQSRYSWEVAARAIVQSLDCSEPSPASRGGVPGEATLVAGRQ